MVQDCMYVSGLHVWLRMHIIAYTIAKILSYVKLMSINLI